MASESWSIWVGGWTGGDRPRSNDSVTYASHSCLSSLTVWCLESQKGAFSVPARQLGQDVFVRGGIRECVS